MTENKNIEFAEFLEVYTTVDVNNEEQAALYSQAKTLLKLRDWYISLCDFDPISQSIPCNSLSQITNKINNDLLIKNTLKPDKDMEDRLTQIIHWVFDAIVNILKQPRHKILREHSMVAINSVKEVDNKTIEWLSRQTGRNVREKLVGKKSIKAISKRMSLDTLENRVFKALLSKIAVLLLTKLEMIGLSEKQEELLQKIQGWMNREDVLGIKQLTHVVPNNVLLQDKSYKKIWRSWLDLQYLDDNTRRDSNNQARNYLTAVFWQVLTNLQNNQNISILEQPCSFNYDEFQLTLHSSVECMYYPSTEFVASVNSINVEKGFAFASYKGKRLFCHISSFSSKLTFESLKIKDKLICDVIEAKKGLEAKNIKVVSVKPLLMKISFDYTSGKERIILSTVDSSTYLQIVKDKIYHIGSKDNCVRTYDIDFSLMFEISDNLIKQILELPKLRKQSSNQLIGQISSAGDLQVTIELQSLSSRVMIGNNACLDLNLQLITQFWQSDEDDNIQIDCSLSRALLLKKDVKTLSFNSIFNDNLNIDIALKNTALSFFIEKINEKLVFNENSIENLNYLVPDHLSDFATEQLRHCINANFKNASPLPKSIAAVFYLQQKMMQQEKIIKAGDIYLLIDNSYEGIQVTPVVAIYNEEMRSHPCIGITWERHPSIKIEGKSESELIKSTSSKYIANDLSELFNFDDITSNKNNLSFIYENDNQEKIWNKIPGNLKNKLYKESKSNHVKFYDLQNVIKNLKEVIGVFKGHVHCLPLSQSFTKPNEIKKNEYWNWIEHSIDLVKGGQILSDWQGKSASVYLWQDHLPKLSTRISVGGVTQDFYLVNKATIQPQRGKKIAIPIDDIFTLPAQQEVIKLPLNIGNAKGRPKFEVQVQHGSFPLKDTIDCTLDLTYTYGDETPYQLIFRPVDGKKASFKSIAGKWMKSERKENVEALSPEYPPSESWEIISSKLRKELFFSLLDNITDISVHGRSFSTIKKKLKKRYVTESNLFVDVDSGQEISINDKVYFYKVNGGGTKDVSLSLNSTKRSFLSNLRPIIYSLFKDGRSIYDDTAPLEVREKVTTAIESAITVYQMEGNTDALKNEIFMFLSCLHQDCPQIVFNKLLKTSASNEITKYRLHLAYSLGSLKEKWQFDLLESLLNSFRIVKENRKHKAVLEIISIAIWRDHKFIDALTLEKIKLLINSICHMLKSERLSRPTENNNSSFEWVAMIRYLELLLALLRTRDSSYAKIKSLLSYESELTNKIIEAVEEFTNRYGKLLDELLVAPRNYIETRVTLSITKPDDINTPDILYALNLYLTGETGADLIRVTSVSD